MKQRRKQSAEICLLTEKILQLELYILYLCRLKLRKECNLLELSVG